MTEPMTAFFPSVNNAVQALKDLQEAGFTGLDSNFDQANESIHPDNTGGTLSDNEFRYTVNFSEPSTQEQFNQAVAIVEKHHGIM